MSEKDTSGSPQEHILPPQPATAATGGPPFRQKGCADTYAIGAHGYTLQFIISIITNLQPRGPSQRNE